MAKDDQDTPVANPAGTPNVALQMREAHFPGRAQIDAYGNGGFRFADMSHVGSLICLPSGIYGWDVDQSTELNIDIFSKVMEEIEQLEVFLFGAGPDLKMLPQDVKDAFRANGVASDPMNTGAAVRTYNVLLAESRAVGAAFIAV